MGTDFCSKLHQGHENPLFRQFGLRNILIKYYQKTRRHSNLASLPLLFHNPYSLMHKMAMDRLPLHGSGTCSSSVRVALGGSGRLWEALGGSVRVREGVSECVRVCQGVSVNACYWGPPYE